MFLDCCAHVMNWAVAGLLGTVAFAFFCFYLLLAVISGEMQLGLNFLFITIHPMKYVVWHSRILLLQIFQDSPWFLALFLSYYVLKEKSNLCFPRYCLVAFIILQKSYWPFSLEWSQVEWDTDELISVQCGPDFNLLHKVQHDLPFHLSLLCQEHFAVWLWLFAVWMPLHCPNSVVCDLFPLQCDSVLCNGFCIVCPSYGRARDLRSHSRVIAGHQIPLQVICFAAFLQLLSTSQ